VLLLEAKGLQILALDISQATDCAEFDDLKGRKHGAHHECGGAACFFCCPSREIQQDVLDGVPDQRVKRVRVELNSA
jgi:hypothetical protein